MRPEQLLKLHRAMRLEYYPEPPKLDQKTLFENATEKTRFGQPTVLAHTVGDSGYVRLWITPTSAKELDVYETELFARVAARNALAVGFASRLAKMDVEIKACAERLQAEAKAEAPNFQTAPAKMPDPIPGNAEPVAQARTRQFGNEEMLVSSQSGSSYAEAFEELRKENDERKISFSDRMKAAKAAKAKSTTKEAAK